MIVFWLAFALLLAAFWFIGMAAAIAFGLLFLVLWVCLMFLQALERGIKAFGSEPDEN